jgi:hypothetical protein
MSEVPVFQGPVRQRRKCYDGYYRMMTLGEWADHLIKYEEEYEASRQATAKKGSPIFPDLTEEEDRARFTKEELLMEEEARIEAHAERTFDERVTAYEASRRREREEEEARKAAEDEAAKAAFAAEMETVMRASRRLAEEALQREEALAREALEEERVRLQDRRRVQMEELRDAESVADQLIDRTTDMSTQILQPATIEVRMRQAEELRSPGPIKESSPESLRDQGKPRHPCLPS